jgi:hypothetical protein
MDFSSQNEKPNLSDLRSSGSRVWFPGQVPSTSIVWPQPRHVSNQIQQIKGNAKSPSANVIPSTQPSVSSVPSRTTPAPVSNVRVVLQKTSGGSQRKVTVQFNHPPGDGYFAGATVYLKRPNAEPTIVAQGASSPLTFTTPPHSAPHSVVVVSNGQWGSTAINSSPSARLSLR